jgi:hypothetical protein
MIIARMKRAGHLEVIMFKRLSLSALAAAVVLATVALSPASAAHFGRGGGAHFSHGGGHFNRGYWAHRRLHTYHRVRWGHWHYRERIAPVYTGGYSTPVAVGTCPANCLAKDYLPNGSVVFSDRCTNESAVSQPRG